MGRLFGGGGGAKGMLPTPSKIIGGGLAPWPPSSNTSFPALSVYPPVRISLSASDSNDRFYFSVADHCLVISLTCA